MNSQPETVDYGYIYKTTNLINGRIYIGQHKGKFSNRYFGSGLHLKRAINEYGKKSFKVETIVFLPTKKQIDEFECFLIEKYREILGSDKLYNICDGGTGNTGDYAHNLYCKCASCKSRRGENIGWKHSEETRIKMKESSSRHSKYCKCITCIRKINGCHPKDCKCPFCYQKKIGHSKEKIACIICGKIREGYNGTVGIKCRKCEDLSR